MSRKRTKSPPFLMVPRYLYRSKAFRSLDGNACAIYLALLDRYNGHNNGSIGLGNRDAGALVGKEKDTGKRGLDMLLDRGFIAVTSDSTFNQKRLAREWRLTHLPDDRTGHKATKDFMTWEPEKQNAGAQVRSIGAQVRSKTPETGKTTDHRRTHAPVSPNLEVSQARRCATSRSTIPPVPELEAARLAEEAPSQKGRAHRSEQAGDVIDDLSARSNKTVHVSEALIASLNKNRAYGEKAIAAPRSAIPQPSDSATPLELDDGQRSLLRWLIGFDGPATHRKAQQNLSNVLKGDAIAEAAISLVGMGLLEIQEAGRSRVYVLLDAGRNPALLHDPDQFDLVNWLEGARQ